MLKCWCKQGIKALPHADCLCHATEIGVVESFDFDFRFLLPPKGFTTMEGLVKGRLSFKPGHQSQEPTMPELGVQLTSCSAKFTLILSLYHCVA